MALTPKQKMHIIAAKDTGTAEKNIINKDLGIIDDFGILTEYNGNGTKDDKIPHILFRTSGGDKIIYIMGYGDKKKWKKALGGQYGCTLALKEWSADDEKMSFSASDRFDSMKGTYYRGQFRPEGISLYDLAVDVFTDAQIDAREYWVDPYMKDIRVVNPLPVMEHKSALQIIANAGRCIIYQDHTGKIFLKSSFIPEMSASSETEAYFSHAGAVLDNGIKDEYALTGSGYTTAGGTMYFVPKQSEGAVYLNTGYISELSADADGRFTENPTVELTMEAAYKCFGLTLEFGRNHPEEMTFHAYYNGELQQEYHFPDPGDFFGLDLIAA